MFFNEDILAAAGVEAPTTWAELEEVCLAIKAYDPSIYPWGVDMTTDEGQACFAYYTLNNGGGFLDANGNWALNSAENVEAVEFIINMVENGLTNSNPEIQTRYELQDMFVNGQVAMMIAPDMFSDYCDAMGVNYGVAPIPTNGGASASTLGVNDRMMCFDNDYTAAELAAVKTFFDFFYEDTRYADWVAMEGFMPATASGTEVMVATGNAEASWLEIIGTAEFYPASRADWYDVKLGIIDAQHRALLGEDVQELLDALQAEVAG